VVGFLISHFKCSIDDILCVAFLGMRGLFNHRQFLVGAELLLSSLSFVRLAERLRLVCAQILQETHGYHRISFHRQP
jgi:hypothetical protein